MSTIPQSAEQVLGECAPTMPNRPHRCWAPLLGAQSAGRVRRRPATVMLFASQALSLNQQKYVCGLPVL